MKENIRVALRQFGKFAAFGGLLTVAVAYLYLVLTPKSYQATTKLKLEQRDWVSTNKLHNPYDPRIIPAEYQLIKSDAILGKAIENLQLGDLWGKRYKHGVPLKTNESLALLRTKTEIQMIPQSTVIQIRVTSEEPEETAKIGNEISRVYRDYRQAERKAVSAEKLGALKKQWLEQSQKLAEAEDTLKKLRFEIQMSQATNPVIVLDSNGLQSLQHKRIQIESDYVQQQNLLNVLKSMNHEKLRQVLPTMVTNQFFDGLLDQLTKAEAELAFSKTNSAPDSLETKHAVITVSELNKRVEAMLDTILTQKAAEVDSIKAELDKASSMLKHAHTSTNDVMPQYPAYTKAFKEVEELRAENNELKEKLDAASMDAVMPTTVSAEILTPAETPWEPALPNRPAAFKTMSVGAGVILLGVLISAVTRKRITPQNRLN
jgi:polysaccharide biosynthesis transport protein